MQNLAAAAGGVGAGAVGGGGVAPGNMSGMDPDIRSVRLHMQEKILAIILQRQVDPTLEQRRQRCKEIARRLEEGLFKIAQNKEEYENMNTLESRLSNLIKRASVNNTQRNLQLINSSSSVGTMIPTPGTMIP